MENPSPWPSIGNLSVWYADKIFHHGGTNRKRFSIHQTVYAYEKIDGTNLGIQCDGRLYGRRYKLEEGSTSYQRIPLGDHNMPSQQTVQSIKVSLIKLLIENDDDEEDISSINVNDINVDASQLLLYGELLCNPERYGYRERGLESKWLGFGGVLTLCDNSNRELAAKVSIMLSKKGFLTRIYNNKVVLRLNPTLNKLLNDNGIDCPALLDQGPLKDVCLRQKGVMIESKLEGLVLIGMNFMKKWKIGVEDESKGLVKLTNALDSIRETADNDKASNMDIPLLSCLIEVAGNKGGKNNRQKSKNTKSTHEVYTEFVLSKATASAMSKYDAIETYFVRGGEGIKWIKCALTKEVANDLGATSCHETKHIETYIQRLLGTRIKLWKGK